MIARACRLVLALALALAARPAAGAEEEDLAALAAAPPPSPSPTPAASPEPTPAPTRDPPAAPSIVVPRDHPTVQAAVDAAGPGDVIAIEPGRYQERVLVTGRKEGLTIQAADPADPPEIHGTPNASRDGIRVDDVDNITLRHLRIIRAYDAVRLNGVENARLEDLYLENSALAIRVNGGSGTVISRCRIRKTRVEQGITIDGAADTTVRDTAINASAREGVRAYNSPGLILESVTVTDNGGAAGIEFYHSPNSRIAGCAANDNRADGIKGADSPGLTFAGNAANGNEGFGLRLDGCPPFTAVEQLAAAGNTAAGNRNDDLRVNP